MKKNCLGKEKSRAKKTRHGRQIDGHLEYRQMDIQNIDRWTFRIQIENKDRLIDRKQGLIDKRQIDIRQIDIIQIDIIQIDKRQIDIRQILYVQIESQIFRSMVRQIDIQIVKRHKTRTK